MSPAPQQTNAPLVVDTSVQAVPTDTIQQSLEFTGLPAQQTATSTPSSTSDAKSASPLDNQAHGSGKSVGIAIGIAIGIVFLVILSTLLLFSSRKRKQAKMVQQSEARLLRRSEIEDAPPPYLSAKHLRHASMQKGELPPTPTRPQGIIVNEREPIRSDTTPSMPMTSMTEGSWATLPTLPTQPTMPTQTYNPYKLAPLPPMSPPSRFST